MGFPCKDGEPYKGNLGKWCIVGLYYALTFQLLVLMTVLICQVVKIRKIHAKN